MSNEYKVGGHLEDPDDPRYWDYKLLAESREGAGGDADLRPYSSTVHNQKNTSSCVANAVAKALEIKERRAKALKGEVMSHTDISRLHLYFLSRELHQAQTTDSGTYISKCCDALRRFGMLPEHNWPFSLDRLCVSPGWAEMRKAYKHKMINGHYRIKSTGAARVLECVKALQSGDPVVYGTTVDRKQWYDYTEGKVLQPVSTPEGRHATVLVGWDQARGLFIGENSWGTGWGDDGCYLMSPDVIEDLDSKDFWVLRGYWEEVPEP